MIVPVVTTKSISKLPIKWVCGGKKKTSKQTKKLVKEIQ